MTALNVQLTSKDGGKFGGYMATPKAQGTAAIVVLQEIFGINANIRGVVDSFAEAGYLAIAPDLFWRQTPGVELNPAVEADRGRATEFMKALDPQLAISDSLVAASYVRELNGFDRKVGAVGYCLGGKLAFLMAMQPGIDAAVSYYGVGIQGLLNEIPKVRAKTLLHVAGDDHLCPPDAQAAIAKAVAGSDRIALITHLNVGHAFARSGGGAFNAEAAERANSATYDLLHKELGATQ